MKHRRAFFVAATSSLALALVPFVMGVRAQPHSAESPLGNSGQMLLVITDDWSSVNGTAQRFERDNGAASWRAVSSPVDVVVGRAGLAWGRGLHLSPGLKAGTYGEQ